MTNDKKYHPQVGVSSIKVRSSNLELYRIICMLMIVAHHYVVNSGLDEGPIPTNPMAANSIYLALFGAWGKVGINCFMLITGYFMCSSNISFRKILKLLLQVYLYRIVIYPIFLIAGYESFSMMRVVKIIMPVWDFQSNFTSCFIIFYLTIPFLKILIQNLTKRQHELLILLALVCYTFLGSIPKFEISFNYISWFCILFFVASYIRMYPNPLFNKRKVWGLLTLGCIAAAFISILFMLWKYGDKGSRLVYFFVVDSNKIIAFSFAVCSFLWFKNINIKYNRIINAFGAGTFGVLLIHAQLDAMRRWLWKSVVDCVGNYTLPLGSLVLYSIGTVMTIFVVCNIIDQLRINTLEKVFFKWYDKRLSTKADMFINKLIIDTK